MEYLSIDPIKCKRDFICCQECPQQILVINEPGTPPVMRAGGAERCIRCGHCVAVCPHGALSLNGFLSPQDCPEIKPDLLPEWESVFHLLSSRRSIRSYRPTPLSREMIEELLRLAQYAPSGHNRQPVQWLVIEGCDQVRKFSQYTIDWLQMLVERVPDMARLFHMDVLIRDWERGLDRIGRGAPHLVLAYAPDNAPGADTACILALNYLEIAAYANKIGACWAGYLNQAINGHLEMHKIVSLPQGHKVYGAMLLGYPHYRYRRIPPRKPPHITWQA